MARRRLIKDAAMGSDEALGSVTLTRSITSLFGTGESRSVLDDGRKNASRVSIALFPGRIVQWG